MFGSIAHDTSFYRIRIKGSLKYPIADWLENITVTSQENGETLITGKFADQSALRGLLDQLWNLNITVLSVERISNEHAE